MTQSRSFLTRWRVVSLALMVLIGFAFTQWRAAITRNRTIPDEPFRIAGNLYYVGHTGVTAFLLTSPEGHILIDGGYPRHGPLIMESISKLGFDIGDVRILLNSHAHSDHAGSLRDLQQASGAELWVSRGDSAVMADGGRGDKALGPARFAWYLGGLRFPAPRIDRILEDGDTIQVGSARAVAHVTPGHTRGCTSWEIPLEEGDLELRAVSICSLTLFPFVSLTSGAYPEVGTDFEASFQRLRSIPADIFLASHTSWADLHRKNRARQEGGDSIAPFIDPEGYRAFIDRAERTYLDRFSSH
ncbi:MAG: subclass B3 metallo-beta-lactamase [Gemmatimonadetes bacterium]|nr:subclass B3 metallo-beta-lactamase [Gemmatimonadota bacterium]NNL29934.1 subclass B3 metallo-beta-lactamase [Gemmatimonadota bacterium]